jgi:hypothetical protein
VQWVPTRTTLAPARCGAAKSRTAPMPGDTSVAMRARFDDAGDRLDPFQIGVCAETVNAT